MYTMGKGYHMNGQVVRVFGDKNSVNTVLYTLVSLKYILLSEYKIWSDLIESLNEKDSKKLNRKSIHLNRCYRSISCQYRGSIIIFQTKTNSIRLQSLPSYIFSRTTCSNICYQFPSKWSSIVKTTTISTKLPVKCNYISHVLDTLYFVPSLTCITSLFLFIRTGKKILTVRKSLIIRWEYCFFFHNTDFHNN